MIYACDENFVLPLSHDEVVHGKGSLLARCRATAGSSSQTCGRCSATMFAHPGKKLLFMGSELAQGGEWHDEGELDWWLSTIRAMPACSALVRDLNHAYRDEPALWQVDFEREGFRWLEAGRADENTIAFACLSQGRRAVPRSVVCNFSPVVRDG